MELKYIFKLILKWLWLIILIPALAGAGAFYICQYKTVPVYEAKATMYIANSMDDPEARVTAVYGDITSAQKAVGNYAEIIKSKNAVNQALSELNLKEYPAERFLDNIKLVLPTKDSFIFGITVRDVDAALAADMANKLSEILVDRTNQFMKSPVLKSLDKAEIPGYPINDNTRKNVPIAAMAGLLFSVVIIFVVEYLRSIIIKDEDDVQKYLGLPVVASIPYIKALKN